jgi:hypothetical protein
LEYDTEISDNKSILNIPLTAAILSLAWLTGSDIYVTSLDKTFKESMNELKNAFREMFPKVLYYSEIITEKIVDNKNKLTNDEERTGLLFSGARN